MKPGRVLILLWGSIAFLIVAGSAFYSYERWQAKVQADAKAKAEHDADQQKIKEEIASLGVKYNAVSDWRAGLRSHSVYSATLQNKLVRSDGRPVLFFGELHDVANVEGSLHCVFDSSGEADVRFVLDCSQEVADYLMQQPSRPRLRDFLAVVAQVSSVAELDGQSRENPQDEQDAKFQANGRCVDLLSLANYDDFLELLGLSYLRRTEH